MKIYPHLVKGEDVQLDFTGVSVFAASFFNYGIGQLLQHITTDELNRLLTFKEISPIGLNVLKRSLDNAKQYYGDLQYRQAVDAVVEEYAASC
jgi:hypothetical protein